MSSSFAITNPEIPHTGVWTNYFQTKNAMQGLTLTLKYDHAKFLTAFLVLYVKYVGSKLWFILSFVIHQYRSSLHDRDGLHHQQQVVLRNIGAPMSAAWMLSKQWYAWRGIVKRPLARCAGVVFYAAVFTAILGASSILSAEVTSKTVVNRLKPDQTTCGIRDLNSPTNRTWSDVIKSHRDSVQGAEYSARCYQLKSIDANSCSGFVQPWLDWTEENLAPCPFEDGVCAINNTAAYSIVTYPIDSREDLGINTRDADKVIFRKQTVCAPLNLTKYTTNNTKPLSSSSVAWKVNIGSFEDQDHTFFYDNVSAKTDATWQLWAAYSGNKIDSDWSPIPALNRTDADVTVIFMTANSVQFRGKNADPIFGASVPVNSSDPENAWFRATKPIVAIGCTEQYRVCQPFSGSSDSQCTPFDGAFMLSSHANATPNHFNKGQLHTISRLEAAAKAMLMWNVVLPRGASALQLQDSLNIYQQYHVDVEQWKTEVLGWSTTSLAILQQDIVNYISQPTSLATDSEDPLPQPVTDHTAVKMCWNQLGGSGSATGSFSVVGIGLILGLGGLIILLSMGIERFVGFLQRHYGQGHEKKRLNWCRDEKLQLQCMMYESMGMGGSWNKKDTTIPTTEQATEFGGWDRFNESLDALASKNKPVTLESLPFLQKSDA